MARSKRIIEKTLNLNLDQHRGDVGSLQYKVMNEVVEKDYDKAIDSLKDYREGKKSYPGYIKKTNKLFDHSEELINAIRAKKNFPSLAGLTQNKQEELAQKVKEHWEELRITLRRLKTIEKELEMEDARSTLWVVRSLIFAVVLMLIVFVVKEAIISMGIPVKVIVNDFINWVF